MGGITNKLRNLSKTELDMNYEQGQRSWQGHKVVSLFLENINNLHVVATYFYNWSIPLIYSADLYNLNALFYLLDLQPPPPPLWLRLEVQCVLSQPSHRVHSPLTRVGTRVYLAPAPSVSSGFFVSLSPIHFPYIPNVFSLPLQKSTETVWVIAVVCMYYILMAIVYIIIFLNLYHNKTSNIWSNWLCFFSHTHQWMIEQVHEMQLGILSLYYISHDSCITYHVTSIVLHRYQGRQYHLEPLKSLWHHDFFPGTNSTTDLYSIFRNFLFHYLLNGSIMTFLASFFSLFFLEQTKLLDAEFMSRSMGKPTTWTDVIICWNDVINWRKKFLGCSVSMMHVYFHSL